MSTVAILGAGPLGASIAHRLAERARVRSIRLIDSSAGIAAGKALDIQQAGPIGGYDTRLDGAADELSAAGAGAIVFADDSVTGEWEGERGLALVARLARAGTSAPFVFAGPKQIWLMESAVRELKISRDRIVGTAAAGVVNSVAALIAIEVGRTGVEVAVCGRPPGLVIGWSAATVGGSLVADVIPSHRLLAISNGLPRLWPPGPQTISAPTALVVEALVDGSRRLHQAMSVLDDELGVRNAAFMLPLELGHGRIRGRVIPSLSPQERTGLLRSTIS